MQFNVLRGLPGFSTPFTLLAAFSLVGAVALAGGCASDLDDPEAYQSPGGGGGAPPTVTGGTPGSTGGSVTTTGGSVGTTGGSVGTTGGAPAAGGSTGGGTAPPLPACAKTVLTAQCTTCHAPATKDFFGGLDLMGDDIGTRLRNAPAKNSMATNAASCGNMLINADNPAQSVLLKRVTGKGDCGDVMPPGTQLSAADVKCFQDWVMAF